MGIFDQNSTSGVAGANTSPFAGLSRTLGGGRNGNGNGKNEKPLAQLWLNVGYQVEVPTEEGGVETRFVSLPAGIPLDTQEPLATNQRNEIFAQFQAARNGLLESILAAAKDLRPGEERIIGEMGGLQIQLRRVHDPLPPAESGSGNIFARALNLSPAMRPQVMADAA